jgi:uncharacterized protein with GYD domain
MIVITLLRLKGKGMEVFKHLKELKTPTDVAIHNVYFTFGQYDATIIIETLATKTSMNFFMEIGFYHRLLGGNPDSSFS